MKRAVTLIRGVLTGKPSRAGADLGPVDGASAAGGEQVPASGQRRWRQWRSLRPLPLAMVALAGGLATATAYQPVGLWPVGMAGLVAGLWALRRASGWRAGAVVGLAYGLGVYGWLFTWTLRFGLPGYAALVTSQAVFAGIVGAVVAVRRREPAAWVVLTASAWTLAEAVRSRVPVGGFEWGQLAQAVVDLPVRSVAASVGALGLTGALVAIAAAAVVAAERGRLLSRLGPLVSAAVLMAALAGLGAVAWTKPAATISVAITQVDPVCRGDAAVDCPGQQAGYLRQFSEMTAALRDAPDLLLWGESSVGGRTPGEAGTEVVRRTGGLPAPLLAGVTTPVDADHFYNRNVLYDADGRVLDSYAKRQPVPFGEYVPARWLLGSISDADRLVPQDMVRGTEPGWLNTPVGPIGTVSSWELSFARHARDAAAGGQGVVTLTTQSSYEHSAVSDQLLAMARLRAAELGKPMMVAATTGRSTLVPAGGRDGPATRLYGADQLTGDVTLMRGRTPFAGTGEAVPVMVAGVLMVGVLGWRYVVVRLRPGTRVGSGPAVAAQASKPPSIS